LWIDFSWAGKAPSGSAGGLSFFSLLRKEFAMVAQRPLARMLVLAALAAAAPWSAAAGNEAAFYKACYLESHDRDFAAAAMLFQQAADDANAPAEIRVAAKRRLAECREELAATDMASLMPAESLAYVQLANIGAQAKSILETLGLAGDEAARGDSGQRIPIEEGLSFPVNFALSPALVREIGKLGGAAAALTGFDDKGVPQGVVVVHVGDSDLVRGLVETSMQVVTPNESIEGYPTFRIPVEGGVSLWLAQTERLLVLSPSREAIAAVVGRLKSAPRAASLKESPSFRAAAEAREHSLLFAWADSQRAAPLVMAAMAHELPPQELMAAHAALGLDRIECATLSLGATRGGVRADAAVRFKPGPQHFIYGLLRTAPIGADALRYVPKDAAVVAAIGLNPPTDSRASGKGGAPQIALMDLGRELFANVRSASVFLTASDAKQPEIGVVVYAQDAAKSRELWTQLIGLPAQFGFAPPEAASETKLHGRAATQYAYPGAPPIFVSQASENALVVGTAKAVESALVAAEAGDDAGAGNLLKQTGAATSKAVFLQMGPLVRCGAAAAHGPEREKLAAVAPLVDRTTASLTIDEEPTELRVRVELAGVPRVSDVLQAIASQATLAANGAASPDVAGR
jgi:hypothetical protein